MYELDQGTKQDKPPDEGKQKRTERGAKQKARNKTGAAGPTQAQRGAQQNQEDNKTHQQEHHRQNDPKSPTGQHIKRTTRPPKGNGAAQTIFVQSAVRLSLVNKGVLYFESLSRDKGRAHETERVYAKQ